MKYFLKFLDVLFNPIIWSVNLLIMLGTYSVIGLLSVEISSFLLDNCFLIMVTVWAMFLISIHRHPIFKDFWSMD